MICPKCNRKSTGRQTCIYGCGKMIPNLCLTCGVSLGSAKCKLRCDNCGIEARRVTYRKANSKKYQKPEYKAYSIARASAYQKTEKGRLIHKESNARYYQTPAGRALRARTNSQRRDAPGNPQDVADLVFEIHTLDRLCVKCGLPAQEADHILPIALGGSHDRQNLQPLCRDCHKAKTTNDRQFISMLRG